MNIIILGDRYKRGMKSKGCVGLIKIGKNTNIFQQQYKYIQQIFPDSQTVYISGFESKKFSSFLLKNNYNDIHHIKNSVFSKTNTGFSINLAAEYLVDDCLILDGSSNLSATLLKYIQTNRNNNLLCIGNRCGDIGCVLNETKVDSLSLDLDNKIYDMVYLTKKTAIKLQQVIKNNYHYAFLFEIINILIDLGENFNYKTFNRPQLCYH